MATPFLLIHIDVFLIINKHHKLFNTITMIEYIEINKTKHPVRINRRALISFEKESGSGINSLASLDTEGLTKLLFKGLEQGYSFEGKDIPFKSYEAYEDALDEMPVGEFYEEVSRVIASFFPKEKKK